MGTCVQESLTWAIIIVGGAQIAGKWLFAALVREVAGRITATIWGIQLVHLTLGKLTRRLGFRSKWDGEWAMEWDVVSENFLKTNKGQGTIYRCFGTIAFVRKSTTNKGTSLEYGFVGKLSCGRRVATGIWFDKSLGDQGYHGAFQLRMVGPGENADGKWVGFSETDATLVNAGEYRLAKL